jgi:hypothetical protein
MNVSDEDARKLIEWFKGDGQVFTEYDDAIALIEEALASRSVIAAMRVALAAADKVVAELGYGGTNDSAYIDARAEVDAVCKGKPFTAADELRAMRDIAPPPLGEDE